MAKKEPVVEEQPVFEPESGCGKFLLGTDGEEMLEYDGEWVSELLEDGNIIRVQNGEGTLTINEDTSLKGTWRQGEFKHGIYQNSELTYVGEFQDNKFHGKGRLTWKNGNVYDGQWENNLFHGIGTLTLPDDNTSWTGKFILGKYYGNEGKLLHPIVLDPKLMPVTMRFMV